jgi:hypothetical protein
MGWNYVPLRNTKTWALKQIEDCKNVPDVNSRLMFLGISVAIIMCMLILTVGLFYSDRVKEVYEGGMGVLLGGHGVSAWGRSKTKGDSNGDGIPDDQQVPAPAAPAAPAPATGSTGAKG